MSANKKKLLTSHNHACAKKINATISMYLTYFFDDFHIIVYENNFAKGHGLIHIYTMYIYHNIHTYLGKF